MLSNIKEGQILAFSLSFMLILTLDPVFDGKGEQEQQSHYIAILWVINIRSSTEQILGRNATLKYFVFWARNTLYVYHSTQHSDLLIICIHGYVLISIIESRAGPCLAHSLAVLCIQWTLNKC